MSIAKIELLSPARDYECAKAAIDCGADAVYVGASAFSARASAANTTEDIIRIVDYAHRFYVRVYVALNTIVYNEELASLQTLVEELHCAGVDALIVQDMAFLELSLPPIALHASTQCHITTSERARFLSDAGFSRIVLARELSIGEISRIHAACRAEIECFVHGALCVSYSGRCFLSHAIGGRSGNRGECAQPCRREWELLDSRQETLLKGHLLSLRDMNRGGRIGELLDAGVSSFKIEGRLMDMSYVKNVTAHYRRLIDDELDSRSFLRSSSGVSLSRFIPAPEKSFNRGFTEYFPGEMRDGMSSHATPKSLGAPVGSVIEETKRGFRLDTEVLRNGDGIVYFVNTELRGMNALVEDGLLVAARSSGLKKGTIVYRNRDVDFEKSLERGCERKISVSLQAQVQADTLLLTLHDDDQNAFSDRFGPFDRASDCELARRIFSEGISRTGTTIFRFDLAYDGDFRLFIPPKQVNEIRRNLLSRMQRLRAEAYRPPPALTPSHPPICVSTIDPAWAVANEMAEQFYRRCGAMHIAYAPELTRSVAESMPLLVSAYCPLREYGLCGRAAEELYLRSGSDMFQLHCECRNEGGNCGITLTKL